MRSVLVLAISLGLMACTRAPAPEAQVRALLAQAEHAATSKDVTALTALVSERYKDDDGRDRQTLGRLLRVYFLRHDSIHLLTRIVSIRFPAPDRAEVVIAAALAGTPFPSNASLDGIAADIHRLDISLAREGSDWRAMRVAWRSAQVSDLF
ncbi:MAG: hypothetical protein JSW09_11690 [Pseudomonadota bacterium]|nr:MAG: hypothetical protein JSW09_11690 [Pseudomonadota bacterium]